MLPLKELSALDAGKNAQTFSCFGGIPSLPDLIGLILQGYSIPYFSSNNDLDWMTDLTIEVKNIVKCWCH